MDVTQGLARNRTNGPDFVYKVYSREADRRNAENVFLGDTPFANFIIRAPSNQSIAVEVIPSNSVGVGEVEDTIIPAVRDAPCEWRYFANRTIG